MPIELQKEDRESAITSIRAYSAENLDEHLGNLAASALLDFFLEEVAPSVYNRAVADVQERLQVQIMELDLAVNEEEFQYSRKRNSDHYPSRSS